jgi:ABC-type transport system involved in multi-copper enzyme maturation permease subunit
MIHRLWAVAMNTFRQTLRERLFLNILIFGVFMLLLGMILATITFGYPDRVVRSIGLSGISISANLIALLVGVSLIHQEIDRKTLFVVLTRPIQRWEYALGRYLGLLATIAVSLVGLTLIFCVTLKMVRGEPLLGDILAISMAWFEAAVIAGIALCLSAFSTPTLSAGMGLGIWMASATTDDLLRLTKVAGGFAHDVAQVVYYALPSMSRFNFREAVIYQQAVPTIDFVTAGLYGVVYSMLLVCIASMILNRREMV